MNHSHIRAQLYGAYLKSLLCGRPVSPMLMRTMGFNGLFRIYWFAALATIIIWILVGVNVGVEALFTVLVLTLLETTLSADNAVVNSKVLITMSPFWQRLFMTVGIF